jgi:uncharacterized protein (DUF433 family)
MARKQQTRVGGDLRDYPRYSIEEAARYLCIPESTMKAWVRGYKRKDTSGRTKRYQGVLELADPERGLLSFFNLAEAYVLRFTRGRDVPLARIRLAIEYIRERYKDKHALLRRDFATHGTSVFIRELGLPINASRHGQIGIKEVLKQHLRGIQRGPDGLPAEIQPLLNKKISINPAYSSGEPVVTGTGIMVSMLAARSGAGDNAEEIARDYGIERTTIEQAIKAYQRRKAA